MFKLSFHSHSCLIAQSEIRFHCRIFSVFFSRPVIMLRIWGKRVSQFTARKFHSTIFFISCGHTVLLPLLFCPASSCLFPILFNYLGQQSKVNQNHVVFPDFYFFITPLMVYVLFICLLVFLFLLFLFCLSLSCVSNVIRVSVLFILDCPFCFL